ncbi:MAG: hypothetical protein RR052_06125, partial [Oscillospiraceae bacterium]
FRVAVVCCITKEGIYLPYPVILRRYDEESFIHDGVTGVRSFTAFRMTRRGYGNRFFVALRMTNEGSTPSSNPTVYDINIYFDVVK